ncbi:MAG TPA: nucleoside triphosphate pyrophosphohydrolase [Firmicutes bacterium]|nr:nucleoside triphosphate pyrophosphohydrolase [Bacillota bacterium]
MDFTYKEHYTIDDLIQIMALLRGENGCPWDKAQTHESIRKNFLEETYEVVEAIDLKDSALLREELGDVLLQVVFHARMEEEAGHFDFAEVCDQLCKKLVFRHPHVFGTVKAEDADEALQNWTAQKMEEKGQKTYTDTLNAAPKALPALMYAEKVQGRAAKAKFDYPSLEAALVDLESELVEFKDALLGGDSAQIEEEFGDLLFSCVNVSRFAHLDPENSLYRAVQKFIRRFSKMEAMCREKGISLPQAGMDVLNMYWKEAKRG